MQGFEFLSKAGQDQRRFVEEILEDQEASVLREVEASKEDLSISKEEFDFYTSLVADPEVPVDLVEAIPGLRSIPDESLVEAGKGKEKSASEGNDRWALRRADQLRAALGWDLKIELGDLPLKELDDLLSNLFSRAVKVKGGAYPSGTLMNMMGGFNRIIRRASDVRSMSGGGNLVERDFNIKDHPVFAKTRMVLRAVVKKSARDGINKKRNKVETLTNEMETAILSDVDHQVSSSHGCQKRLAFFCLVSLGIRGGTELYDLKRIDLTVQTDSKGVDYVKFEERQSKNNLYTLDRYNEEQFRKSYHTCEDQFVFCLKQYVRHLPPLGEGTRDDLFLGPITNPATNIWYNRLRKVSKDRAGGWLRSMLSLVGLSTDHFSNKSGRATLVTRMATQGVPNEIGMLITGHHTSNGYLRYDRTQDLRMAAAALVASKPELSYESALTEVSMSFVKEEVVGNTANLKPLVASEASGSTVMSIQAPIISTKKQASASDTSGILKVFDSAHKLSDWHKDYDGINWDEELVNNKKLSKYLGGGPQLSVGNSMVGNTFHQCTVNIICNDRKEGKENYPNN